MRLKSILFLSTLALHLAFLFTPKALLAANESLNVPRDYGTIQAAIDEAERRNVTSQTTGTIYSVLVEPGNYSERIALKAGVDVLGRETARTIITGGGSAVPITADSTVTDVTFANFTVIQAAIGIQVGLNAGVLIQNNVFSVGTNGIGIQVTGTATATEIINNTFYRNKIAITRESDIKIINNIFSENTTNISQSGLIAVANIDYNIFNPEQLATSTEPIGTNSLPNTSFPDPDPLFVDPINLDFHVQEGSPCIDNGKQIGSTTVDMGAYGIPGADTIPYIVSGVTATALTADSITVTWSANKAYNVTNTVSPGGYNVYYRLATGSTVTVDVPGNATSTVISGLTASSNPPAAPVLNEPDYANETLLLSWSSVAGATKYIVHVLDQTTLLPEDIEVVGATSKVLTGLVNDRHYTITVSAVSQPVYHLTVTAYDNQGPYNPGVEHESAYSTPEVVVPLGSPAESLESNAWDAYPEALTSYPNLANKGWCFIATAAYGHYDAPQVQALRDFRDRFLMTNAAGSAFVQWYYAYGPRGAAIMNAYPWLKPIVRAALMPAVGGALFLTRTPAAAQAAILMLGILLLAMLILRKKTAPRGGSR